MLRYGGVRLKVKETSYRILLCLFLYFVFLFQLFCFGVKGTLFCFEILMLSGIYDLIIFKYKLPVYAFLLLVDYSQ